MSLPKLIFIWKKKGQILKITLPILTLVLSLIYLSSVTSAASSSNKLQPFPISASCPSPDQPCVLGVSSTVYQDIGSDVHISGNVGIGTNTPQVKLDVIGAINGQFGSNFGSFGTCCAAAQTPTLGLSEYTASNGRMAWLQFHDAGAQEAFLRLAKNTRTFEIGDSQNVGTSLAILTPNLSSRSILLSSDGEITSNLNGGYGQLRMVGGSYGAFFRNDGANTYLLLTNSGDQYGGWNGYRPLYVNDTNGNVTIGTNLCLNGVCKNAWPGGQQYIGVTGISYSGRGQTGNNFPNCEADGNVNERVPIIPQQTFNVAGNSTVTIEYNPNFSGGIQFLSCVYLDGNEISWNGGGDTPATAWIHLWRVGGGVHTIKVNGIFDGSSSGGMNLNSPYLNANITTD